MQPSLVKSRKIALIALALIGVVAATASWWLRQPVSPEIVAFFDIQPADGASLGGSEVWVSWRPLERSQGTVFWRSAGDRAFQQVEATGHDPMMGHLTSLKSGKYEYYVQTRLESRTERSALRTLTVNAGLVFEGPSDLTVLRDYDQHLSLKLRNTSGHPMRVTARSLTQYPDLLADFVGIGSADEPFDLAPGASMPLRLVVTAADAGRDTYEIPVEASGTYSVVRIRVNRPEVKLSFAVVGEDLHSLAKTVELRNGGGTLTDLAVRMIGPGAREVLIQPATTHALVYAGQRLEFTITPVLYLEFQQVTVELEASAAGQQTRFPLEFKAPVGGRLMGIRLDPGYHSTSSDSYCTNRPSTCSNLPSPQGNGSVPVAAVGSSVPVEAACTPCDIPSACAQIREIQKLIEKYADPNMASQVGSFRRFAGEFDTLFAKLATNNLACRYDAGNGLPPAVDKMLADMRRARTGFKTLEPLSSFPVGRCVLVKGSTTRDREECDDQRAIEGIYKTLGPLANAVGCPSAEEGGPTRRNPCPDVTAFENIKKSAERGKTTVDVLTKVAGEKARTNAALKEALEETGGALEQLVKWMDRIINVGTSCEKLADFVKKALAFKQAIDDINNAGCDSAKMAKGFDDLFRTAGELGQYQPFPQLGPVFDILKENSTFFSDNSRNLIPEQREREKRQLGGADGYVFSACQP